MDALLIIWQSFSLSRHQNWFILLLQVSNCITQIGWTQGTGPDIQVHLFSDSITIKYFTKISPIDTIFLRKNISRINFLVVHVSIFIG